MKNIIEHLLKITKFVVGAIILAIVLPVGFVINIVLMMFDSRFWLADRLAMIGFHLCGVTEQMIMMWAYKRAGLDDIVFEKIES
jgi:hypothetical protein